MQTETAPAVVAEVATPRTFETVPCSRCGGSGNYSFCPGYGTTCFKCGGCGKQFTKKGAAARAYFETLCTVTAEEVKVGDLIQIMTVEPGTMGIAYRYQFSKVLKIEAANPDNGHRVLRDGVWVPAVTADMLAIETTKMTYAGIKRTAAVRLGQSKEDKAAKIAAALAYEDTLTQAGKPRKVRK